MQNLRVNFDGQKRNIEDRLDKNSSALGSKVQRLSDMLQYAINEDKKRSHKILEDCESLKESSEMLKYRVEEIRSRVKRLEDELGMYTGEDKYLL
jgi:chromosome segregation ATPase